LLFLSKRTLKPRYFKCFTNALYMYKYQADELALAALELDTGIFKFFEFF
jgi:hypothetical protein